MISDKKKLDDNIQIYRTIYRFEYLSLSNIYGLIYISYKGHTQMSFY